MAPDDADQGLCRRETREIGVQSGIQHALQLLLVVIQRQIQTVETRVARDVLRHPVRYTLEVKRA